MGTKGPLASPVCFSDWAMGRAEGGASQESEVQKGPHQGEGKK